MKNLTQNLKKGALGTVAAGAMALASATPAMADDRHRDRGIDAGDVIAGAVIIGGIAAMVAYGKGRNLGLWVAIGAIGGTPALIAALLLKED